VHGNDGIACHRNAWQPKAIKYHAVSLKDTCGRGLARYHGVQFLMHAAIAILNIIIGMQFH
jgi:hypothetical protein